MSFFRKDAPPGGPRALLDGLYRGEVFTLPESDAARELRDAAWGLVRDAFADIEDPRLAHERLPNDEMFARVKDLRRTFYCAGEWRRRMERVVEARGFPLGRAAFDPLRLRLVASGGHRIPAAAPLYGVHRDVWYAHPPCLVTWWLPLHGVGPDDAFAFYPDAFGVPAPNDSEIFDYGQWVKDGPDLKIGWQHIEDGERAPFPALRPDRGDPGALMERREVVALPEPAELVFSGAHLHGTLPQSTGQTRFSLDFRFVPLDDLEEGRGAPVVDDRSRGSAVADYHRP